MGAADTAISAALSKRGDKYVFGAAGPDTFDCSGLVVYAYGQAGIKLPHFTGALWATLPHVPKAQMQPGDLIFPTPSHVGIYLGNNQFVVAPHTGSYVQVENVGTVWGVARVTGDPATSVNVNASTGGSGTSLVGLPSDIENVFSSINKIADWISSPDNLARISVFMLGCAFLALGLWKADTITTTTKQVVNAVR